MVQKHNLVQRKVSKAAGEFVDQGREWDRKNGTLPIGSWKEEKENLAGLGDRNRLPRCRDLSLTIWNHGFVAFCSRERDSYLEAPV